MKKVREYLETNGFSLAEVDIESLLNEFKREMEIGLSTGGGSLQMIPAYISTGRDVPAGKPVVVVDAGGTNLRVAVVKFDASGKPQIERFAKHRMPGTEGEVSVDQFYDTLARHVKPLLDAADDIGFCFSYAADIQPDGDARLRHWTKQVEAPEVVGALIGSGLCDRLSGPGYRPRIVVLNDTVATLLAGRSTGMTRRFEAYVGFILGTGTNTAYMEANEAIGKIPELAKGGRMAINVESGGFAKAPRSKFDETFDATTNDPGHYQFEKMISGGYMGGLGLTVLQCAAADGLFTSGVAAALRNISVLPNKDLDDFCHNPFITTGVLGGMLLSEADRRTILALCTPLYERAALFTAANIAAAVLKTGAGHDPLYPVGVTVDGSTFYRTLTAELKSRVEEHLRNILSGRSVYYQILQVDEAPLLGAAVAGLTFW